MNGRNDVVLMSRVTCPAFVSLPDSPRMYLLSVHRRLASPLMSLLAMLALLTPLLTPFAPDLAGWSASHRHIYRGAPIPHAHPGDRGTPSTTPESAGRTVRAATLLCPLHGPAHEQVPDATEQFESDGSVAFVFEDASGPAALALPISGGLPPCPAPLAAALPAVQPAPISAHSAPLLPPPRA